MSPRIKGDLYQETMKNDGSDRLCPCHPVTCRCGGSHGIKLAPAELERRVQLLLAAPTEVAGNHALMGRDRHGRAWDAERGCWGALTGRKRGLHLVVCSCGWEGYRTLFGIAAKSCPKCRKKLSK